jgi:hypothetical protein
MDDGTYNKSYYSFATASFSADEHDLLLNVMRSKFDLDCSVQGQKHRNLCVTAKNDSNKKFRTLVEPFIVPSMLYKIDKPVSPAGS